MDGRGGSEQNKCDDNVNQGKLLENNSSVVEVLSATKQRRSLGQSSKREKASKKPTRTTVVNPSDTDWPDVDEAAEEEILQQIEISLKCLQFPIRHCPLKEIAGIPKEDRSKFRQNWLQEDRLKRGFDVFNYTSIRSALCIGVNCCQIHMELNEICGLIIEKNVEPQIITKLLVPIANSKNIPIVSLVGLKSTVKKTCNINCIALGFKKICRDASHRFHPLLSAVLENWRPTQDLILMSRKNWNMDTQQSRQKLSDSIRSSDEDVSRQKNHSNTSFSIQEEVDKMEKKMSEKRHQDADKYKSYVTPKVRKIIPQ